MSRRRRLRAPTPANVLSAQAAGVPVAPVVMVTMRDGTVRQCVCRTCQAKRSSLQDTMNACNPDTLRRFIGWIGALHVRDATGAIRGVMVSGANNAGQLTVNDGHGCLILEQYAERMCAFGSHRSQSDMRWADRHSDDTFATHWYWVCQATLMCRYGYTLSQSLLRIGQAVLTAAGRSSLLPTDCYSQLGCGEPCLALRIRDKGPRSIHTPRRTEAIYRHAHATPKAKLPLPPNEQSDDIPMVQRMQSARWVRCGGLRNACTYLGCVVHNHLAAESLACARQFWRAGMMTELAETFNLYGPPHVVERTADERMPHEDGRVWRTPMRADNPRLVGLEVEFAEDRPHKALASWAKRWGGGIHEDGSCGAEAVTPPIAGSYIPLCVYDMCAAMNKYQTLSDACGVHVHVDASDLGWYDIRRLAMVWSRVEALAYAIGGQGRVHNRYCSHMGAKLKKALLCDDWKANLISVARMSDGSGRDGRSYMKLSPPDKKDGGRYQSMNLMPWLAQRRLNKPDATVEFRLHRGCHNAKRLTNWAMMLAAMVQWIATHSDADAAKLPKSAARALCVMCPAQRDWILGRLLSWRAATSVRGYATDEEGRERIARTIAVRDGTWVIKGQAYSREEPF